MKGPKDIESKYVIVTPELAKEWLGTSIGNRRIDYRTVQCYSEDMKSGNWKDNGEAIRFDSDGHLRDGHHRLIGVTMANVPVFLYVTTGLDPKECSIYDRGRPRTIQNSFDMMAVEKWERNTVIISVSRMWYLQNKSMPKVSDQDVLAFEHRNRDTLIYLYNHIYKGTLGNSRNCICKKGPVAYAIFCALNCSVNKDEISDFMMALNSGVVDDVNKSSVIGLRNMMLSECIASQPQRIKAQKYTESALKDYINRIPWKKMRRKADFVYSNAQIIKTL